MADTTQTMEMRMSNSEAGRLAKVVVTAADNTTTGSADDEDGTSGDEDEQ